MLDHGASLFDEFYALSGKNGMKIINFAPSSLFISQTLSYTSRSIISGCKHTVIYFIFIYFYFTNQMLKTLVITIFKRFFEPITKCSDLRSLSYSNIAKDIQIFWGSGQFNGKTTPSVPDCDKTV